MMHDKKSRAGKQLQQGPKRSRLRHIPMNELEPIIRGAVDPVDEIAMRPLRASLRGFSDAHATVCIERKLLPHRIACALETVELLSQWIVLARAAQMVTGVPASILIAEIWFGPHEFSELPIPQNDLFARGKSFASLGAAVLDHASYLANEPKFQSVMRAKENPTMYLAAIGKCKLWRASRAKDRVDTITENNLLECDALPIQ